MFEKSPFAVAVKAAAEEARERGDRRIGTEHLLLGLLRDPSSATARALGVTRSSALTALTDLDHDALRSIGIEVGDLPDARPRKHPWLPGTALTSSARAAVNQAIKATTMKSRNVDAPKELLLALLDQHSPDPVAALVDRLGLDRAAVRARLS